MLADSNHTVVVVVAVTITVIAGIVWAGAGFMGVAMAQQGEEEPNNQRSEATQIEVGPDSPTRATGILGFGDEDWLAFEAQEGDTIVIDYSGSAGNARLRGPDGSPLDAEGPYIRRLRATASETGTYYVQLTTVSAATGDYSMNIELRRGDGESSTASSESDQTATPTESSETSAADESEQTLSGEVSSAPDGEWPDSCEEAPTVNATGIYEGAIDTPGDVDRLKVRLAERGDYVEMRPLIPVAEGEVRIETVAIEGTHSWHIVSQQDGIYNYQQNTGSSLDNAQNYVRVRNRNGIDNSSWRLFAESSPAVFCIGISEVQQSSADLPYEWELHLVSPPPEPADLNNQVFTQEEVASYEERLASLEQQMDQLETRVDELENSSS